MIFQFAISKYRRVNPHEIPLNHHFLWFSKGFSYDFIIFPLASRGTHHFQVIGPKIPHPVAGYELAAGLPKLNDVSIEYSGSTNLHIIMFPSFSHFTIIYPSFSHHFPSFSHHFPIIFPSSPHCPSFYHGFFPVISAGETCPNSPHRSQEPRHASPARCIATLGSQAPGPLRSCEVVALNDPKNDDLLMIY